MSKVDTLPVSSESLCPICDNVISSDVLHRWSIDPLDLEYVRTHLESHSLIRLLKIGEIAAASLSPERLTTHVQVQESLEMLSKKAEELLSKQREHLEKLTEVERQDKKDIREEALQEQRRVLEDYQLKILDLQGQMKQTSDQHLAEVQRFNDEVRAIREKLVGPGIGRPEETSLLRELKSACPVDGFSNTQAGKGRADIVSDVRKAGVTIGRIVVSVKAEEKWSNDFRNQLKKNLEQERTPWGILVTKAFPSDALNDSAYLDDDGLFLVKFDYAAVAYLGMRQAVVHWHEAQDRLDEIEKKVTHEKSILDTLREWIRGDKFADVVGQIDDAKNLTKETEDILDNWEDYNQKQAKKVHQLQKKLRDELVRFAGALEDLKTRLN